ncbi:MAG TPA: MBL fold metallo-hydrolase [Gaiellaceae bacterium]|nr:MBL fold metallo-hydrolase [Gaiellaceae bacterium]
MAALIDLLHLGRERVIGAWLLPGDEPALVDCGPSSCIGALEAGLAANGLGVEDLRHLVLTHIHLDHAGAAGLLVRRNPDLRVHVSEIGAPHLVAPDRLERSARRLYGEDFDRLWGALIPVPADRIEVLGDRIRGLEVFATPGHASHHVSYLHDNGTCYAGDVAGVRVPPSRYVAPVTPPPDVDLEAWGTSLDAILGRGPERLHLPHFGEVDDPDRHIAELRERLSVWAERVRLGASEEEFVAAAETELAAEPEIVSAYRQAGPLWQSYAGLARYWRKSEGTLPA